MWGKTGNIVYRKKYTYSFRSSFDQAPDIDQQMMDVIIY